VLLLFHGEVRAQDLLERVLLRRLLERVVGRVLVNRLHERRIPGELLDLLVGLRDAGSAQSRTSSRRYRVGRRGSESGSRTARASADAWNLETSLTVSSSAVRSSSNARRDIEMPTAATKRLRASRTGAAMQQKSPSNSSFSTAIPCGGSRAARCRARRES